MASATPSTRLARPADPGMYASSSSLLLLPPRRASWTDANEALTRAASRPCCALSTATTRPRPQPPPDDADDNHLLCFYSGSQARASSSGGGRARGRGRGRREGGGAGARASERASGHPPRPPPPEVPMPPPPAVAAAPRPLVRRGGGRQGRRLRIMPGEPRYLRNDAFYFFLLDSLSRRAPRARVFKAARNDNAKMTFRVTLHYA